MIDITPTKYGFKWGALEVERTMSIDKHLRVGSAGSVIVTCRTPKTEIRIHVTKTGKLRICNPDGTEWHNSRIYP